MEKTIKFPLVPYFLCLFAIVFSGNLLADGPVVIDLGNGWKEVKPGGGTTCARGEEFSFFLYTGKTNKLAIDFMGGGACWNEQTCAKGSATFYDSVDEIRKWAARGLQGMYNHNDPRNPLADWHHVIIPYCTGDIHWGDSVRQYGQGDKAFTIHHKGAVNARAVLNYVFQQWTAPEKVLVTGCSAGSYGSIYWTPFIRERYPQSKVYQFGDSGAGIITTDFAKQSFPGWNPTAHAPNWIPGIDPRRVDWYSIPASKMYTEAAKFYPDVQFSQFNTAFDSNQVFYFELMGGGGEEEWSQQMFDSMEAISSEAPNFHSYVGAGQNHCIIPYDYFYSVQTEGVSFVDWFKELINDAPVKNISCVECDPIN